MTERGPSKYWDRRWGARGVIAGGALAAAYLIVISPLLSTFELDPDKSIDRLFAAASLIPLFGGTGLYVFGIFRNPAWKDEQSKD